MPEEYKRSATVKRPAESLPCVSVEIISYNNCDLLQCAVKSLLSQTYPNIELTISDDASAAYSLEDIALGVCNAATELLHEQEMGMEEQEHKKLWWAWKKENKGHYYEEAFRVIQDSFPAIKRLSIRRNAKNLGTVKHLKELKKEATGKYLMFLAADDILHDPWVIEDMIEQFERMPEDAYVLTSQCGMYDKELEQLYYYAVTEEIKEILINSTPQELFAELCHWCIVPAAGTIYKRKVFEIYGDLDDRYHLVEDWTYFLKLTKGGGKIYFYDRLTYDHRDGGVSHGEKNRKSLTEQLLLEDYILLTQQEILPYLDELTPLQKAHALKHYQDTCREYEGKYGSSEWNTGKRICFFVKNAPYYMKKFTYGVLDFFNFRAKRAAAVGFCALLLSYLLSLCPGLDNMGEMFFYVLGLGGMLLLGGSILSAALFRICKLFIFTSY